MTDLEKYIQSYFGIEPGDLERIGSLFSAERIKKGDYFLKTGTFADRLSFIQNGMLRVFASHDGKEVTQWISTRGYFVTDLSSLVFDVPARWNIQAIADSELYSISKKDYREIGNIIPKWHQLEKLFIAKCFTILEDRIFSHLSMTAEERYRQLEEHNKELLQQVPLHFLASMLGMTPETFSRIRAKKIS